MDHTTAFRLWSLILILLVSGCLTGEDRVQMGVESEGEKMTIQLPTSTTTTTLHENVPIKDMDKLITTTTAKPKPTTTTTTTSTSTTATLLLKMREYATAGNNTFYMTGMEDILGTEHYTLDYNTSDNKWTTVTFTNTTYIDGLEAQVLRTGPGITMTLLLKESEYVRANTPEGATALLLGGGLGNRSLRGYRLSLDTPQSERAKLRIIYENESAFIEASEGDVILYYGLEVGVLETRLPGGYVLVYALSDSDAYGSHEGVRFCGRDLLTYHDAKTLTLDQLTNTTYDGMNLTVKGQRGPVVTLTVYKGDFNADFEISCGSRLELFGKHVNLIWYGGIKNAYVKIVAHSPQP
ncbi:MAG: hypothetical protein V1744_08075 [Candidatus Altiarchaeota archaeon]